MLRWSIVVLVLALVAGLLGFTARGASLRFASPRDDSRADREAAPDSRRFTVRGVSPFSSTRCAAATRFTTRGAAAFCSAA